jgi:nitrogenase molybdenum-iron protein NifN
MNKNVDPELTRIIKNKTGGGAVSTQNPCKMCTPLGASLAYMGIEGCIPLLHGSQGCATYIRRYTISHFREPVDIASSSFSEESAIFGGGENIKSAISNVISQYKPECVGVASTCLSETIGDDVKMFVDEYKKENSACELPEIVHVSTASYRGSWTDGFHDTVRAIIDQVGDFSGTKTGDSRAKYINILPGITSPADIREIQRLADMLAVDHAVIPNISDRLDGGSWEQYTGIAPGGTPMAAIKKAPSACSTLELGITIPEGSSGARLLTRRADVPAEIMPLPIGVAATDDLIDYLSDISGSPVPDVLNRERARCIDALVDGHKYVAGKKIAIFGESDLVLSLARFCHEIGMKPVLCASGTKNARYRELFNKTTGIDAGDCTVIDDADFVEIEKHVLESGPDLLLGTSKGYKISRKLNIPLVRTGFPIHDRFGGQRLKHFGYNGSMALYDRLVNTIIERVQDNSDPGYTYI